MTGLEPRLHRVIMDSAVSLLVIILSPTHLTDSRTITIELKVIYDLVQVCGNIMINAIVTRLCKELI